MKKLFEWMTMLTLTREIINGLAVDVGLLVLLFVVAMDSLALTILIFESKDVVCRLEFECRSIALAPAPDEDDGVVGGSLSTFRKRSGMSIVSDLLIERTLEARCWSSTGRSEKLVDFFTRSF